MPLGRRWTSYLPAVAAAGLLVAGLGAAPAGAAVQLDVVYVSPTGDDSHSGHTWQQPLRTLTHARDVVRELLPDALGDVTVRLLPGTYRLDPRRCWTRATPVSPATG